MVKSGQGYGQNGMMVTPSSNHLLKSIVLVFLTSIMWAYSLLVLLFFSTALLYLRLSFVEQLKARLGISDSLLRKFVWNSLILWIIFVFVLWIWRFYNKKKFGSLHRRRYPPVTTDEDMLKLGLMSERDYVQLRKCKIIAFDKNPITHIEVEHK